MTSGDMMRASSEGMRTNPPGKSRRLSGGRYVLAVVPMASTNRISGRLIFWLYVGIDAIDTIRPVCPARDRSLRRGSTSVGFICLSPRMSQAASDAAEQETMRDSAEIRSRR